MSFEIGSVVRLRTAWNGCRYSVRVTGPGGWHDEFAGVIVESDLPKNAYNGECDVGVVAADFITDYFEVVK